jgi:hypothetical protein
MTKTGPRDDTKLAAIKLEWWPRSDGNRWPPSLEIRMLTFLREDVPKNGHEYCDQVTDNFRIMTPTEFRIIA